MSSLFPLQVGRTSLALILLHTFSAIAIPCQRTMAERACEMESRMPPFQTTFVENVRTIEIIYYITGLHIFQAYATKNEPSILHVGPIGR